MSYGYPLTIFVASPTPATITYSPSVGTGILAPTSFTAGCVGDTLILNKPTGNAVYTSPPLRNVFVSCLPSNDEEMVGIVEMASGPSPLTWTIPVIDPSMECYVSYGPLISLTTYAFSPYSKVIIYPRPAAIGSGTPGLTCANCSSGYRSDPGAPACSECGLGYYSNPVSQTCTVCPVGTKCPTTTTPEPVDCGAGYYQGQSTQSTCLPCPVGKYCALARTVTPVSCPAGSFRDTEGAASLSDCHVCPTGSYCVEQSVDPVQCANGTYEPSTGGTSSDSCLACPVGKFCQLGTTTPVSCPAGSYRSSTGARNADECSTCTTGHYCPISSVTPTECVAGTYNPLTGQDDPSDCQDCPAGKFCLIATTTPDSCAAGTYRDIPGAQSQAQCFICTTGHYCPVSTINPLDCVAGTYNGLTGQDDASDCQLCPTGQFCPIATTNPSACVDGSYRDTTGAASQDDCFTCTSGNYCPLQSVNPTQCVAGTYNPSTGATNTSYCLQCETGKYSLTVGSSADCPNCVAGSFCVNPTTIQACPTHTTSTQGSSSILNCRCLDGFQCSYTKQITATVTLNTSFSSFTSDAGGIQTAFKQQVALAAGVQPSQVIIKNVAPKTGGRRLLGVHEASQLIDVHMVVKGAEGLRNLHRHLAAHPFFYHGHVWTEAHSVSSQPVQRRIGLFA